MVRHAALIFVLVAQTIFLCLPASAQLPSTNSWTWGGSGFWHHATNWSSGVPTTNTSHVQIIVAGLAKTIIVDSTTPETNLTINALRVTSSTSSRSNWLVLSNVSGITPFTVLGGVNVSGPGSVPGRLILTNSTMVVRGTAGSGLNTSNAVVIVQPASELRFTNGAQAKIGVGASSTLTIASNAIVRVADSNFTAGVNVGGVGNVTISGGTLDVGWTFTIGEDAGATGHVVVATGLLRAVNTNANAEIGQNGGGQLTLSNGVCQFDDISVGRHDGSRGTFRIYNGVCSASDLSVGRFTNSVGLFSMTGGQLLLLGHLYAGREGTGTVSVSGGYVQAGELAVATTNTSFGTATFSGGTSVFSSTIVLGSIGSTGNVFVTGGTFVCTNAADSAVVDVISGTLSVTNGNVSFDSVVATNSAGRLSLNGGAINAHSFFISNGVPLVIGNGTNAVTLRLDQATNVFADGLIISSNTTLIASGKIVGPVVNRGTILIGEPGTLTFDGAVTNNRTMIQSNGGVFTFRGILANNGTITPRNLQQDAILNVQRNGNTAEVFFSTHSGLNYTLQFKNSLNDAWQSLGSVAGNGSTQSLTDSQPITVTGQRYYRIQVD